MSNERIDEFLSWRSRLDDLAGVPGQGLDDREATWERLVDRLAETPRRRRFMWYRLVAACVLLALVPAVRFFHVRRAPVVAVRPVELKKVVSPANVEDRGRQVPVEMSAKEKRGGKRAAAEKKLELVRVAQPVDEEQLARLEQAVPLPDSGAASAISPKQLKNKPLRVVNINELPGNAGPGPAITAKESARHFEVFILPGQTRMALPPPPPAADAALIKVKLTSN